MRFLISIFFGWCLTSHKWTARGNLPKPSISVRPSVVVPLGENITILCKSDGNYLPMKFVLCKVGSATIHEVSSRMAERDEAIFHIIRAKPSDEGIYLCITFSEMYQQWSSYSDNVHIKTKVLDVNLPKPSIKMSSTEWTSLGLNVTIECQGPEKGLNFSLFKSEKLIASQMEPERQTSEFHVLVMMLENAKTHTCQYHRKENPFVWSQPSDPLELVEVDRFSIAMWAGVAAGILLVFLLLLLLLIFYQKRRKGSTASDRNHPVNMLQEPEAGEDPNDVFYTVLNLHSLEMKQAADLTTDPESCVYASVAEEATKKGR